MTDPYLSPNLGLNYLAPEQSQKHVTVNETFRLLDGISQLSVVNMTETSPPPDPDEGTCYLVSPYARGVWYIRRKQLALWSDQAWHYITPREGWRLWDRSNNSFHVLSDGVWWQLGGTGVSITTITGTVTLSSGSVSTIEFPEVPVGHMIQAVQIKVLSNIKEVSFWHIGVPGSIYLFGNRIGWQRGTKYIYPLSTPYLVRGDLNIMVRASLGGQFTAGEFELRFVTLVIH